MASSKLPELKKLTAFCRKNGILHIKTADFEVQLSEKALSLPEKKEDVAVRSALEAEKDYPAWESLSEEQKLLWSSTPPGMDQADA